MPLLASAFLPTLLLLLPLPPPSRAISAGARSVETTFLFLLAHPDPTNTTDACPNSITHATVSGYVGINPASPEEEFDGVLWTNLRVNDGPCLFSNSPFAATFFVDETPSPPDTSAAVANPFFLTGTDNAARRCDSFRPPDPSRYYFTDDLPRFRQRFVDSGILPAEDLNLWPDEIASPVKGDIYMISNAFRPDQPEIRSVTSCIYRAVAPTPSPTPTPSPPPDDGSACFPASALAFRGPARRPIRMDALRLGQLVLVDNAGTLSPIVSFTHRDPARLSHFVELHFTASRNITGAPLLATAGHLLRRMDGRLLPAGDTLPGDALRTVTGVARVSLVSVRAARGLYAPVTAHGDVVVEGVVASCYTTAVPAGAAHALLAPVRAVGHAAVAVGMKGVEWCGVVDVLRGLMA